MVGLFLTLEGLFDEIPFQNFERINESIAKIKVPTFNLFLQRLAVLPENNRNYILIFLTLFSMIKLLFIMRFNKIYMIFKTDSN